MTYRVTVQENGRVVLPAAFRRALGLTKGARHQLLLDVVDGRGMIRTELDQVEALQSHFGRFREAEQGADALAKQRRAEARNN